MRARIRLISQTVPERVASALYMESEIEAKEVKRRTPVDKGPLRASVHVLGPFRSGRKIWTSIVAGGPAAPYAIYVHEDPDAIHPVGQWKFLESVIMESRPFMGARVAARIRQMNTLL